MSGIPHVEIRPKPANGRNSSGAVSQISTPRARNGPLVFVNSSDSNTELEKQGNRRTVKKWAMLNRNARQTHSSSSSQKPQFLSWDSRGDRESSNAASAATVASAASDDNPFSSPPVSPPYNASAAAGASLASATRPSRPSATFEAMPAIPSAVESLCIDVDAHARSLIEHHLATGGNDVLLPNGATASANRGIASMLATSPAALCSLNTSNLMRSGDKDYRDYYLSMALMHTTALIREMDRRPTSVVFYCVSLLMWISSNTGDEGALQAHFNGMIALMIRHWDLFSLTPYFRDGPFFYLLAQNEGTILPNAFEPSYYSLPTKEQSFHISLGEFADLQAHGWLSEDLVSFLPNLLAMQSLISRARVAQLNLDRGRDLFAYILYNTRTLAALEHTASTSLEQAVRIAAQMHAYSAVFQDAHVALPWLIPNIHAHLSPLDVRDLTIRTPLVMLWLALSAGAFASNGQRAWFASLAASAAAALGAHSFEDAADILESRLLWARGLDEHARRFWDSAVRGSRRSSDHSST